MVGVISRGVPLLVMLRTTTMLPLLIPSTVGCMAGMCAVKHVSTTTEVGCSDTACTLLCVTFNSASKALTASALTSSCSAGLKLDVEPGKRRLIPIEWPAIDGPSVGTNVGPAVGECEGALVGSCVGPAVG